MKLYRLIFLLVFSTIGFGCANQAKKAPESEEYKASVVFKAFVAFCFLPVEVSFSHENFFKKALIKFPKDKQGQFISVEDGSAWAPPSKVGNMVFTLHKNGMCSLHVRKVDSEDINFEYDKLIGFLKSQKGFKQSDRVQENTTPTANFRYNKLISNDGRKNIQVAVTTDSSARSGRQALLTLVSEKEN